MYISRYINYHKKSRTEANFFNIPVVLKFNVQETIILI